MEFGFYFIYGGGQSRHTSQERLTHVLTRYSERRRPTKRADSVTLSNNQGLAAIIGLRFSISFHGTDLSKVVNQLYKTGLTVGCCRSSPTCTIFFDIWLYWSFQFAYLLYFLQTLWHVSCYFWSRLAQNRICTGYRFAAFFIPRKLESKVISYPQLSNRRLMLSFATKNHSLISAVSY